MRKNDQAGNAGRSLARMPTPQNRPTGDGPADVCSAPRSAVSRKRTRGAICSKNETNRSVGQPSVCADGANRRGVSSRSSRQRFRHIPLANAGRVQGLTCSPNDGNSAQFNTRKRVKSPGGQCDVLRAGRWGLPAPAASRDSIDKALPRRYLQSSIVTTQRLIRRN